MNIEKRVTNLENLIDSLIKKINQDKQYSNSDINGVRKGVSDLIPYTDTKTAYFNESEKTFYNVPEGTVTVIFDDYVGEYSVKRVSDRVTVYFETLSNTVQITINVK